jgi:hypothetical protein
VHRCRQAAKGQSPVPKRARSDDGACSRAVAELVGPSSVRQAGTASAPSSCIATIGPLVMNSARRPPHDSQPLQGTQDASWESVMWPDPT